MTKDKRTVLKEMNSRFESLQKLAKSKGLKVTLFQNDVVEHDGQPREWTTLTFTEGIVSELNTLDELEKVLTENRAPKFARFQTVYVTAKFVAAGTYQEKVPAKILYVSWNDSKESFQYYCSIQWKAPDAYVKILTPTERWYDESELSDI